MKLELVLRIAQILRSQPACTMSLTMLHSRLQRELGADAGTYGQIYRQLKNLPDCFVVIDTPHLLPGAEVWPAQLREEYDSALEGAGLGSCVRVALAEPSVDDSGDGGMLGLATRTVGELWAIAGRDLVLRDYLASLARQLDEVSSALSPDGEAGLPTTRPRDLPQ